MVGVALIVSGVMSLGSYYFSGQVILALSGAKPATRQEYFDYFTVTENLTMSQRMPMPDLYVIEDSALNAFATGRDPEHAVVCATTGLLDRLNRSEIEGVVAHELSHIQNYDIRLMSVVSILVGFIALLADWMLRASLWGGGGDRDSDLPQRAQLIVTAAAILLVLLSPVIANLIKLAISRRREFLADASGVSMTKNPDGLINALNKISRDHQPLKAANKATAHLYIENPLKNIKDSRHWFAKMFQTHPPVEERIKQLKNL
jgi:heat shock protein HtpX